MGDYDISERDLESLTSQLRLSDLLSLNDAVEEHDMETILDILNPYMEHGFKEALSPTHATGRNTGNTEKRSREGIITPVGSKPTGYSMAFSDKGTIAGGRKDIRQVKGGAKQPTGISTRSPEDMPTASVTKADGTIVPADKKTSDKIDKLLRAAGLA